MKKISIALLLLVVFGGCSKEEALRPGMKIISMLGSNDPGLFEKTVILYEDDEYLITTYFEKFISSRPFLNPAYATLKQKALDDTVTHNTLFMKDYIAGENDKTYTLAFHLENGACLIYDKKANKIVNTIVLERYHEGGPMTSTGGRRFYIQKKLFLETVDMIS